MREMKDSGFDWIGKTPSHWRFLKGKYIFRQRNSKGNTRNLELLSPSQKFGVIPQSLLEEMTTQNVVKVKEDTDLMAFKTIHKGDFCISLRSFQGGFEYSRYEGVVSSAYQVFYPYVEIFDGYYRYLFKDTSFIEKMNSYTISFRDGKNIAFSDFGNTYIPYPPVEEQRKIANYLDDKCTEIDGLIADIQAQIDTLEQYKRTTIIDSVLRGLTQASQQKESGIDWVGKIPCHWNSHPIYYYFAQRWHKNSLGEENNLLSLSYGRIIRKDINATDGLLPESFNTYNIIEKDDIVLRLTDLQNDKKSLRVGIAKERGIITSAYVTLKAVKEINAVYFYYLIHAYDLMKVLYNIGGGVRQGLNYDELSKLMLIEPPIDEQNTIAAYLDEKCAEIDGCIAAKKEQISTLEAYKKSVIFEYVTGKKEVV